ncbi:MAG: DUF4886 domain-containing protein [Clostridia bacterium]|nr:DUF4886 domain-containing protein [Clostridia bacterium]MBQ9514010.1 DUF4886 domain-containing protein [Clostridia bacterium]
MKILSIGNSFSHDAHRYLHEIAKREGENVETVNLFIGGCSLETHYNNLIKNLVVYDYEKNGGESSGKVSISRALKEEKWDVVTLQQASHLSADIDTYFPYIVELAKYVRENCPDAKIFVHQTWAYDNGSDRLKSVFYPSADAMFADVRRSYDLAAKTIDADGIIYSGETMLKALNCGINVYRDGFHAGFGAGRYLLGLVWYKTFTGNDITGNGFNDFDEKVSDNDRQIIIKAVKGVISSEKTRIRLYGLNAL